MSIKTAIRDFLIEYEHEPSNVVYLNTAHARANAAHAAQLVENDRCLTRMSEIEAEIEIESAKRHEADLRIHTLMNEYDQLRATR